MTDKKNRLLIILLISFVGIAALATSYFIFFKDQSTDNRDQAAVEKNVDITFENSQQQVTAGQSFAVKIYLNTGLNDAGTAIYPDRKVTGVTIPLKYPQNLVEVDVTATQNSQPSDCNILPVILGVFDTPSTGTVKLSKVTTSIDDTTYGSGRFCAGAVFFRLKSGVTSIDDFLDFVGSDPGFAAVGKDADGNLSYGVSATGRLRIFTVAATGAPTATSTPIPTTTPTNTPIPSSTTNPTATPTTGATGAPTATPTVRPSGAATSTSTPRPSTTGTTGGGTTTNPTVKTTSTGGTLPNTSASSPTNAILVVTGVSFIVLAFVISNRRFKA